jgi:hypothetical protein
MTKANRRSSRSAARNTASIFGLLKVQPDLRAQLIAL